MVVNFPDFVQPWKRPTNNTGLLLLQYFNRTVKSRRRNAPALCHVTATRQLYTGRSKDSFL